MISLIMLNYVMVNLGFLFKNILYGSQASHPQTTYQNDLMLQTKHNLPFGSREENLMGFYNLWARCPFWSSNLKQNVIYCFI